MNTTNIFRVPTIGSLCILLLTTCGPKPTLVNPVLATITTTAASAITTTGATLGGNITSDGGAAITERGNKVVSGSGTGSFTVNKSGLPAGITFYVRAYAINSIGVAYGNEVSFITQ